ncbi:MAG TPA: ABC transporter permease [Anaerolineae bacterium]|nr:ABC transporter permease [Anaerolineae bacterium]
MLTIASLTFKEALRKKILLAAVILTLLFLALYSVGIYYSSGNDSIPPGTTEGIWSTFMLLLGIYFSSSIVSLLAIFSAVGSVSSEVENGMLHAILARPIKRRDIILGKFTGYALMLSCYSALLFIAILAISHYIGEAEISGLSSAAALFILRPLILLAVTITGSTRLSTLANGIVAFMLYTVGVVGGMIEQVGAFMNSNVLGYIGITTSLLMPVDSIYRMITERIVGLTGDPMSMAFFGPFGTMSPPSNAMLIYTFIYLIAFVVIAVLSFSRRDIA